jgi:hypothetical protein
MIVDFYSLVLAIVDPWILLHYDTISISAWFRSGEYYGLRQYEK